MQRLIRKGDYEALFLFQEKRRERIDDGVVKARIIFANHQRLVTVKERLNELVRQAGKRN